MCSPIWFPGQSSCGSSLKITEKKVPIHAHVLSQKKRLFLDTREKNANGQFAD